MALVKTREYRPMFPISFAPGAEILDKLVVPTTPEGTFHIGVCGFPTDHYHRLTHRNPPPGPHHPIRASPRLPNLRSLPYQAPPASRRSSGNLTFDTEIRAPMMYPSVATLPGTQRVGSQTPTNDHGRRCELLFSSGSTSSAPKAVRPQATVEVREGEEISAPKCIKTIGVPRGPTDRRCQRGGSLRGAHDDIHSKIWGVFNCAT